MNPFLFGSRERRLFGIYHNAVGRRKQLGAVICPPLGREYLWSHRGCRVLAERLAANGVDVLRFDYFGTGDSAGEGDEVTLAGCVADTVAALDEIMALAGVREAALIGLRLGAVIALTAATHADRVGRLVLWDPVTDGAAHLQALLAGHEAPGAVDCDGSCFAAGFPLSAELRNELQAMTLHKLSAGAPKNLVIVAPAPGPQDEFVEHMRNVAHVDFEFRQNNPMWAEESGLGVGAVPVDILERITSWLQ